MQDLSPNERPLLAISDDGAESLHRCFAMAVVTEMDASRRHALSKSDTADCSCGYAVVLTREPFERVWRKLFMAVCAELMSPEFSADPIEFSRLENELALELVTAVLEDVLEVEPVDALLAVLSPERRLVRLL
jgi:hypothetical protein